MIKETRNPGLGIKHAPVNSTSVKQIGYDEETGDLHVTFHNGKYVYHDVPPDVHESFMMAGSKGQFIHQNIKGQFRHTKK